MAVVIPKVVHRIWFGPEPMRQELIDFGAKWEQFGYETKLWTEANLPTLRNQAVYDALPEVGVNVGCGVERLGVWVQRADIVAYELVWMFGGIVANCDIEPLRPLDELLDRVDAFAGWEENGQWVCNALMGATPQHDFFDAVIEELPERWRLLDGRPMNEQTGPHLLTHIYRMYPDALTVFPRRLFYPYSFGEMDREWADYPDAFTSHHWGHTRG